MTPKKTRRSVIVIAELIFVTVVPIHLYGWKLGLLVISGLTSLLHIVELLEKLQDSQATDRAMDEGKNP